MRTVHSPTCSTGNSRNPADSTGIRRTQIPECVGVTRAKLACLVRKESAGVHRNMVNSAGVHGIPSYYSAEQVQRTPLESGGLYWIPADSTGFHWTPADSTGLHRTLTPCI